MKAVILAAGKGTRMKELTNDLPKPMLKVQGMPILEHIVTGLKSCGIREFFIITGWRAEAIEQHFGDGSRWGVKISYGRQLVQDGTGSEDVTKGGLFFFDDKFCLHHLVEKPSQAELESLRQNGWIKDGETAWYNAGIYIFRPSLFEFTATLQKSARGEYELTDAITGLIRNHHPLAGLRIEGRWVDVRDPEVLARLENE